MFQTLDVMISLVVVYMVLSVVNKCIMSIVKRILKVRAGVVAEEMKTFVGKNTSQYLVPYLRKNAEHLNFLDDFMGEDEKGKSVGKDIGRVLSRMKHQVFKGKEKEPLPKGLRQLSKDQLKEIVREMSAFFDADDKTVKENIQKLGIHERKFVDETMIAEVRTHLNSLQDKIETSYDNTVSRISEIYENRLRKHAIIWGLILAFAINADFFDMYHSLSTQALARERLIVQSEIIGNQAQEIYSQLKEESNDDKAALKEIKKAGDDIRAMTGTLKGAGLQFGWTRAEWKGLFTAAAGKESKSGSVSKVKTGMNIFFQVAEKLLGLTISGLLISFGAPFWHDLLSSLSGLKQRLQGGRNSSLSEENKPVKP